MPHSLPSAAYTRYTLPKPPTTEERMYTLRMEENRAREEICNTYKAGMKGFTIYTNVPDSVENEMRSLGWVVTFRPTASGPRGDAEWCFNFPPIT